MDTAPITLPPLSAAVRKRIVATSPPPTEIVPVSPGVVAPKVAVMVPLVEAV